MPPSPWPGTTAFSTASGNAFRLTSRASAPPSSGTAPVAVARSPSGLTTEALTFSLWAFEVPLASTLIVLRPAWRSAAAAIARPFRSNATSGVARVPVTAALPSIVPPSARSGRIALAIASGSALMETARFSFSAIVPRTPTWPPPTSSSRLSMAISWPWTWIVDGAVSRAASAPCFKSAVSSLHAVTAVQWRKRAADGSARAIPELRVSREIRRAFLLRGGRVQPGDLDAGDGDVAGVGRAVDHRHVEQVGDACLDLCLADPRRIDDEILDVRRDRRVLPGCLGLQHNIRIERSARAHQEKCRRCRDVRRGKLELPLIEPGGNGLDQVARYAGAARREIDGAEPALLFKQRDRARKPDRHAVEKALPVDLPVDLAVLQRPLEAENRIRQRLVDQ